MPIARKSSTHTYIALHLSLPEQCGIAHWSHPFSISILHSPQVQVYQQECWAQRGVGIVRPWDGATIPHPLGEERWSTLYVKISSHLIRWVLGLKAQEQIRVYGAQSEQHFAKTVGYDILPLSIFFLFLFPLTRFNKSMARHCHLFIASHLPKPKNQANWTGIVLVYICSVPLNIGKKIDSNQTICKV